MEPRNETSRPQKRDCPSKVKNLSELSSLCYSDSSICGFFQTEFCVLKKVIMKEVS